MSRRWSILHSRGELVVYVAAWTALVPLILAACGEGAASEVELPVSPANETDLANTQTQANAATVSVESDPQPSPDDITVTIQTGSVARYIVREQLARLNIPSDAVGEIPDVTGTIVFGVDGAVAPERSKIVVNLSTLRSDEDRRNNFLRTDSLESNKYPMAEFTVRDTPGLPWPLPDSGKFTF